MQRARSIREHEAGILRVVGIRRLEEDPMAQVDVHVEALASPPRVWSVLVDVRSWAEWAPFDEVAVEHGHEVGEVRRLRAGLLTTRERVTGFEPPRRYVYEIVSGLPIRGHVGVILLTPTDAHGTEISWQARFRPLIPGTGWAIEQLMRRVLVKGADGLVRRADALL
jgi:hypothetical protein